MTRFLNYSRDPRSRSEKPTDCLEMGWSFNWLLENGQKLIAEALFSKAPEIFLARKAFFI